MTKSRAERRHHHQRIIDKVKKFNWLKAMYWQGEEPERDKRIRKIAKTRKPCSCHMCGNPRKMFKDKTMQEKRFEQNIEE